jgi:iron(III) transport system permease protein
LTAESVANGRPSGAGSFVRLGDLLRPWPLVMIGCTLLVVWLVFVPLGALFYTAFAEDTPFGPGDLTLKNFALAYTNNHILLLLKNSAIFAIGTSIVSFGLGILVAWVVERTDAPGARLFHALALLAFCLPGLLTTMAWMMILSPRIGWLNVELMAWLGLKEAPFDIYSMGGMIWALSSHYFPLAYLIMGPAFRALDVRMEEAASMSGARAFGVTRSVTLPLMRPAILSALLLLFVRGMESFEVPRLIGVPSRISVLTTEIQRAVQSLPPHFGVSAALGLILLFTCVLGVYLYRKATVNAESFATITGKGYVPSPQSLGAWRWPVSIVTGLVFFVTLGLPLLTLAWQSLFRNPTPPSWRAIGNMTLEGYRYIFHYPVFLNAVKNSVGLGAMSATIVIVITFLMAWLALRSLKKYGFLLDSLTFAPIAIPSLIVGASILFAYLILPIPVYNTIWILLIAYVTMYMPYGMRFISGGMAQIHRELEEVAEVSGASPPKVFARVLLPLLAPVLTAAWLYVFVLAVRELSASIFLAGPGTQVLGTLTLVMWEEGGGYGAVCAMGMVQIVPLIVIVTILRWLEERVGVNRKSS